MNYDLDMCRKSARLWNWKKKHSRGFYPRWRRIFLKGEQISKGKVKEKRGQPV